MIEQTFLDPNARRRPLALRVAFFPVKLLICWIVGIYFATSVAWEADIFGF